MKNKTLWCRTISIYSRRTGGSIGAWSAQTGRESPTLLKLLVGLYFPDSGSIRIGDVPLQKVTLAQIRKIAGYVFQDFVRASFLMPNVYEDVAFAPQNYGLPEEEVAYRTKMALAGSPYWASCKKTDLQIIGWGKETGNDCDNPFHETGYYPDG